MAYHLSMTSIPIIIFIVRKTLTSMSIDNKHFFTVRLTSWIVTCWPLPLSPMAQPASMRPLAMLEVLIIWFTEDMEIFLVWTTRGPSFMVSSTPPSHPSIYPILSKYFAYQGSLSTQRGWSQPLLIFFLLISRQSFSAIHSWTDTINTWRDDFIGGGVILKT